MIEFYTDFIKELEKYLTDKAKELGLSKKEIEKILRS